jgi:hypothetical protein
MINPRVANEIEGAAPNRPAKVFGQDISEQGEAETTARDQESDEQYFPCELLLRSMVRGIDELASHLVSHRRDSVG